MGHFPLEDTLEMEIAVCMLQRSLDKCRYGGSDVKVCLLKYLVCVKADLND